MLGAWAGPTPKASPSELVPLGGNEVVGVVGTKVITSWDILRDVKDELAQRQGTIQGVLQEQLRAANARIRGKKMRYLQAACIRALTRRSPRKPGCHLIGRLLCSRLSFH